MRWTLDYGKDEDERTIIIECSDDMVLPELVEEIVAPLLVAAGYHPKSVSEALNVDWGLVEKEDGGS